MKTKVKLLFVVLAIALLVTPVFSTAVFAAGAEQRQLITPILIVNTGALNVRSGPGPQFTVITTVRGGTELPVLGTNADNTWYLVASPVGAGWVDVSFTIARGDFRFVPRIAEPASAPAVVQQLPTTIGMPQGTMLPIPQLQIPQVIVNTARLNVRSGPGGQYTILTSVPGGTIFEPLGVTVDGVWYLVGGSFGRGWIAAEFTIFRGFYDNIPVIVNAY